MRYVDKKVQLTGKIMASSITGHDGNYVAIRIEDEASGIVVAEIHMSYEEYGKMLAHATFVDCQIDYYPSENIGKRMEVKREMVLGINYETLRTEAFPEVYQRSVEPFEVEGWKADKERSFNPHRAHGDAYDVIFRRYV